MGISALLLAPAGLECWGTSLGRKISQAMLCHVVWAKENNWALEICLCSCFRVGSRPSEMSSWWPSCGFWVIWGAEEAYLVPRPPGLDGRRWAVAVCCRSSHGLQPYDHCSLSIIFVPCCLWKCVWQESLQTIPCHCGNPTSAHPRAFLAFLLGRCMLVLTNA